MINLIYYFILHSYLALYALVGLPSALLSKKARRRYLSRLGLFTLLEKFYPQHKLRPVDYWIHAVSAGEVILSQTLITLQSQKTHSSTTSGNKFLITTTSKTGWIMLKKIFHHNSQVQILIFPFDAPIIMKKLLKKITPRKFIIIEHDLWPHLLKIARQNLIPVILVNAYLKPRDAKLLLKIYRFAKPLFLAIYHKMYNLDLILTQDQATYKLLNQCLPNHTTRTTHYLGNLKYLKRALLSDNLCSANKIKNIKSHKNILTITLGSSHQGEEILITQLLADIINQENHRLDKILFIIIPRHPARAQKIQKQLKKKYPHIPLTMYSDINKSYLTLKAWEIILVDVMGLSIDFYALSDLVLIGDTFIPTQGGHNFLEAVAQHKPTLYGNYIQTYQDIIPIFEKKRGTVRLPVKNPRQLKSAYQTLTLYLYDQKKRHQLAANGFALLDKIFLDENKVKKWLFDP